LPVPSGFENDVSADALPVRAFAPDNTIGDFSIPTLSDLFIFFSFSAKQAACTNAVNTMDPRRTPTVK
jgi:hypothetical protein